ncbi:glycosyltransferase family 25 protein [Hymenobacter humi]|uniref:Glycosyltransferase family 25 protein n=1 Tax=Hymenobacter humi TaxID=1411620 RepID=A0ABW2UD60_9BACT
MKTFVINLERSTMRRASIQKQLDAQEIDFEFIKAVDGAQLSDEYLAKICNFEELAKRPYIQHKGMYGCILSHYHIYEKIVNDNLPYALVLEDDVVIQPGIKAVLAEPGDKNSGQ